MSRKIRVAMLGMGYIGRIHMRQLRKMEDVEIVALCSATDGAKKYNEENGTNYPVYANFDQMLEEVVFDALYVTLPPYAHEGQIEKAADKKIHIFAEKPMALTEARAESIVNAVKENGIKCMIGYHMRFGGAVQYLRKLIQDGVTGRPVLFCGDYELNILPDKLWWRNQKQSGGQVFEQIIHLYDMAYYLMGEADTVTGFMGNLCHRHIPDYTIEDVSISAIHFKNHALGSITGSNCAANYHYNGFKIIFENCVAEFTNVNSLKLTHSKGEMREESLVFDTDFYWEENRYFIDMLKGDKPEFATAEEGLAGVRMVAGVVQSAKTGGMPQTLK